MAPCNLRQSTVFAVFDSSGNLIVGGSRFCDCPDTAGTKCLNTLLKGAEADALAAFEDGTLIRDECSGLIQIPPDNWYTVIRALAVAWNGNPGAATNSRSQLNKIVAIPGTGDYLHGLATVLAKGEQGLSLGKGLALGSRQKVLEMMQCGRKVWMPGWHDKQAIEDTILAVASGSDDLAHILSDRIASLRAQQRGHLERLVLTEARLKATLETINRLPADMLKDAQLQVQKLFAQMEASQREREKLQHEAFSQDLKEITKQMATEIASLRSEWCKKFEAVLKANNARFDESDARHERSEAELQSLRALVEKLVGLFEEAERERKQACPPAGGALMACLAPLSPQPRGEDSGAPAWLVAAADLVGLPPISMAPHAMEARSPMCSPLQVSRPSSPNSVFESPLVRRPSAVDVGLNFDTPMPPSSQQTSEVGTEITSEIATKVSEMEAKIVASDKTARLALEATKDIQAKMDRAYFLQFAAFLVVVALLYRSGAQPQEQPQDQLYWG